MEPETIYVLEEIRGILFLICFVFVIGFLGLIFNAFFGIKKIDKRLDPDWRQVSEELLYMGDLENLISHCDNRIDSHPHDPAAYWWKVRAYLAKGESENASILFDKVIEVDPAWTEYVNPYRN